MAPQSSLNGAVATIFRGPLMEIPSLSMDGRCLAPRRPDRIVVQQQGPFASLEWPEAHLNVHDSDNGSVPLWSRLSELTRACLQLSRIIAAAICTPARKFLASLS